MQLQGKLQVLHLKYMAPPLIQDSVVQVTKVIYGYSVLTKGACPNY